MKWVLFSILIILNIITISNVFLPSITDWAVTVPSGIDCSTCTSVEVKMALAKAAEAGRAPFLRGMQVASYWLFGIFLINSITIFLLICKNNSKNF